MLSGFSTENYSAIFLMCRFVQLLHDLRPIQHILYHILLRSIFVPNFLTFWIWRLFASSKDTLSSYHLPSLLENVSLI